MSSHATFTSVVLGGLLAAGAVLGTPAVRAPAPPPQTQADLAAAIQSLASEVGNLRGALPARPPGKQDASSITLNVRDKYLGAFLEAWFSRTANDGVDLVQRHHFWTYQDVIDRYGPPQRMTAVGELLKWSYVTAVPDRRQLVFWFFDGFCIDVQAS
ncbi:MAG TPA: hypothetical protein VKE69_04610 [Planctomycetota bacterium]|nr:hypothetical protein [Planctomycetota bacterium]